MGQERLSVLAILSIENERAKKPNLDQSIVNLDQSIDELAEKTAQKDEILVVVTNGNEIKYYFIIYSFVLAYYYSVCICVFYVILLVAQKLSLHWGARHSLVPLLL